MTIAAHAARFSPQYTLDLAPESPPPTSSATIEVLEHPTRSALAAAARENEFVRAFIADGLLTWSAERLERDPPCCLVYEHGEVVGGLSDLPSMVRHAEKRRGLGDRIGIRALRPDEEVLPYNIGLRWGAYTPTPEAVGTAHGPQEPPVSPRPPRRHVGHASQPARLRRVGERAAGPPRTRGRRDRADA